MQRFTETYAIMQRLHNAGGLGYLPAQGGWRVASLGGGPGFELLAVGATPPKPYPYPYRYPHPYPHPIQVGAFCSEHVPGPPPQLISLDLEPSWCELAEALAPSPWPLTPSP